ncbi:MAG: hypothetical protein Q8N56_04590 [bacterium]|nr:hypothetical protein [bacterium]
MRGNREQEAKEAVHMQGIKSTDGWDKETALEEWGLFKNHHYLKKMSVGKLYECFPKEQELVFNAITQPIKSLTFFEERNLESGIYYPIVVYSGIDGIYEIKKKEIDLDALTSKKQVVFKFMCNTLKDLCYYDESTKNWQYTALPQKYNEFLKKWVYIPVPKEQADLITPNKKFFTSKEECIDFCYKDWMEASKYLNQDLFSKEGLENFEKGYPELQKSIWHKLNNWLGKITN